jgi:hypothetical protein
MNVNDCRKVTVRIRRNDPARSKWGFSATADCQIADHLPHLLTEGHADLEEEAADLAWCRMKELLFVRSD